MSRKTKWQQGEATTAGRSTGEYFHMARDAEIANSFIPNLFDSDYFHLSLLCFNTVTIHLLSARSGDSCRR